MPNYHKIHFRLVQWSYIFRWSSRCMHIAFFVIFKISYTTKFSAWKVVENIWMLTTQIFNRWGSTKRHHQRDTRRRQHQSWRKKWWMVNMTCPSRRVYSIKLRHADVTRSFYFTNHVWQTLLKRQLILQVFLRRRYTAIPQYWTVLFYLACFTNVAGNRQVYCASKGISWGHEHPREWKPLWHYFKANGSNNANVFKYFYQLKIFTLGIV